MSLVAVAITVIVNGTPIRSYNPARLCAGRVMVPLDPYVTAIASSFGASGRVLVVRRGDRFAQVQEREIVSPAVYASTYVAFAPIARSLGIAFRYESKRRLLIVRLPRAPLSTPTPFNPAVPRVAPSTVFTPLPAETPRPVFTGTPAARRTPIPLSAPSPGASAGRSRPNLSYRGRARSPL